MNFIIHKDSRKRYCFSDAKMFWIVEDDDIRPISSATISDIRRLLTEEYYDSVVIDTNLNTSENIYNGIVDLLESKGISVQFRPIRF